jgi:hypothetical protein
MNQVALVGNVDCTFGASLRHDRTYTPTPCKGAEPVFTVSRCRRRPSQWPGAEGGLRPSLRSSLLVGADERGRPSRVVALAVH